MNVRIHKKIAVCFFIPGTTIEMNEVDSLVPNRNDQVGDNGTLIYQPSSGRPDGIALESQSHSPYLPVLCPTGGRLYTPPSSPITQPNDGGGDRSIMCPTSARLNGNHSEALVPSNVICTSAFTATGENLARSGGNVANENEIRDTDSSGYSITARVPLEVGGVEQQPV